MSAMRAVWRVGSLLVVVPMIVGACGSSSGGATTSDGGSSSSGGGSGSSSSSSGGGKSASSSSSGGSGGGTTVIDASTGPLVTYGKPYTGGIYNPGPVDYSESQFHNACAPGTKYDARVQAAEGTLLVGLWNGIPNVANYCDACIYVTTKKGKSAILRVVTYGDTTNNSIDTSPEAYTALSSNEDPRDMTWEFAECPEAGAMMYEFQTGSSEYWTSLWVRNARVPLAKIEVQSANHSSWTELTRGTDGTLTDDSGFGVGTFSIRSTGIDGSQVIDKFDWPSAGVAGAGNFK